VFLDIEINPAELDFRERRFRLGFYDFLQVELLIGKHTYLATFVDVTLGMQPKWCNGSGVGTPWSEMTNSRISPGAVMKISAGRC
jgi:hypothetical protein